MHLDGFGPMHLPGEKSPRSHPADFLFFLEVGHAITVSLKKSEESNRVLSALPQEVGFASKRKERKKWLALK